jgi:hypothetical protein
VSARRGIAHWRERFSPTFNRWPISPSSLPVFAAIAKHTEPQFARLIEDRGTFLEFGDGPARLECQDVATVTFASFSAKDGLGILSSGPHAKPNGADCSKANAGRAAADRNRQYGY